MGDATQEKEALDADNEELFIQLGLLKEKHDVELYELARNVAAQYENMLQEDNAVRSSEQQDENATTTASANGDLMMMQVERLAEEKQHLEDELESMRFNATAAVASFEEKDDVVRELEDVLKVRQEEIVKLQAQNSSLQESLSHLQSINQTLNQQHETMIQSSEHDHDQIRSLQGIISDKEMSITNLNKKLKFLEQKDQHQGTTNALLEEREYEIIKLQTQNNSLQESVLQLQSENQNLQQRYDSLEEAIQQDIQSLKLSSQDETQSLQMILSQKESTQQALSKKLHDSEQKQMQKDEEVLALRTN